MDGTEYSVTMITDKQRDQQQRDQQLRVQAVHFAVTALQDCPLEDGDITKLSKEIYEFIKGE
jgi:hypothetical protein